jgi:ribonuclease T2
MATARKEAWVLVVVWALAVAGVVGSVSARAPLGRSTAQPQREFDYFMFTLLWPGTTCASTRYCCPSNGCCRYVRHRRALPSSLQPPGASP